MTTTELYNELEDWPPHDHMGILMDCEDDSVLNALRKEILNGDRGEWDCHGDIVANIEQMLGPSLEN